MFGDFKTVLLTGGWSLKTGNKNDNWINNFIVKNMFYVL